MARGKGKETKMLILVVNAGSSSVKSQLIQTDGKECLMKALAERIGTSEARLKIEFGEQKIVKQIPELDVPGVLDMILDMLEEDPLSPVKSLRQIDGIGNRIVAGGEYFSQSVLVDDDVLAKIEECGLLAPLHNPAAAACIRLMRERLPKTLQSVVFDTAFHATMPPKAYHYPIPMRYYTDYHIRRYGAHGTSHKFVAHKAAGLYGVDINDSKIITCHIGNGSSVTAIVNGKVVDTSMGLTPLEGMIMGTRCGSMDPSIVTYIMKKEGLTPDQMENLMNKQSGFLGLSEKTSDAREMNELAIAGDHKAKLVYKKLSYDIIKLIGSYVAAMNGVDMIVFTGGIGEHNSRLRRRVCENFTYLGLDFDYEANVAWGVDTLLSTPQSKVKVAVVTTDEELAIARDTMHLVQEMDE